MHLLPTSLLGSLAFGLTCALFAFLVSKIIQSKKNTRRYKEEAARRGCLPAPTLHSNNLLGTSRLKESIKATKEDRGPQYVIKAMNEVGTNIHTLRVPILDYELLVTRDPENVRAIFQTHSADWDISNMRANAFMPFLGEGVFTSTGAQWKHSRALVRPQFAHEQISNLPMIERHVQAMQRVLKVGEDKWTAKLDLQPLFFYFSIDAATDFLYGQSVHSQAAMAGHQENTNGIDGAAFSRNFNAVKHLVDKRGALGKFYWLMPLKKMKQHCKEIHEVIDRLVAERLASKRGPLSIEEKATRKFVLLDELVKLTENPLELRNETLHTLMAGRDTTGSLLGWTFYFLARHPRVFNKMRSIILDDFGESMSSEISFAKLRRCEYIQWVMNEAIRIVAIVPMNERIAIRDTELPRGGGPDGSHPIFVREGIQILIPTYAMQHRPDIWGEDAEDFKPERWENRKPGWEWIPFGGGPRKCLGRKFICRILRLLSNRKLMIVIQSNLHSPKRVT